ncbi:hypothetical protein V9T40_007792 [Parthenolecanium corni]|uniref:Uncharacterized protein n=1 Tax=Parthenolecanium corni TaxID=536013 RepID=A0AAN9THR4_9HEMI
MTGERLHNSGTRSANCDTNLDGKCDADVAKIQPIRKQWHFCDTDVTDNFSTGEEWNHYSVTKVPLLPDWLNFCHICVTFPIHICATVCRSGKLQAIVRNFLLEP